MLYMQMADHPYPPGPCSLSPCPQRHLHTCLSLGKVTHGPALGEACSPGQGQLHCQDNPLYNDTRTRPEVDRSFFLQRSGMGAMPDDLWSNWLLFVVLPPRPCKHATGEEGCPLQGREHV